jgi:hypothetical protein
MTARHTTQPTSQIGRQVRAGSSSSTNLILKVPLFSRHTIAIDELFYLSNATKKIL